MRHLMPDHRADAAVIHCIICLGVEEWRLQNSGRENDFVHGRVVVRVHRWRRHAPFRAINRLADFLEVAIHVEVLRAQRIHDKRPAIDSQQ